MINGSCILNIHICFCKWSMVDHKVSLDETLMLDFYSFVIVSFQDVFSNLVNDFGHIFEGVSQKSPA